MTEKAPKKEKKAGIIDTICELIKNAKGVSAKEAGVALKKAFPEREQAAMENTFKIQMNRLPKDDKRGNPKIFKAKCAERGTIYGLADLSKVAVAKAAPEAKKEAAK